MPKHVTFSEPSCTGTTKEFHSNGSDPALNGGDFLIKSAIVLAGNWTLYDDVGRESSLRKPSPISGGISGTPDIPQPSRNCIAASWGRSHPNSSHDDAPPSNISFSVIQSKRLAMKTFRLLIVPLLLASSLFLHAADVQTKADPIPFSEIGAKATADYKGDAIGIRATPGGAVLHTGFQKLSGIVTEEGLRLESTAEEGGGLHLVADSIGRQFSDTPLQLPLTGSVTVGEKLVTFTRPGLAEEYSVSADGVRQDFIVAQKPAGAGELRVELALSGARAETAAEGAKLILDGSGRELAYSRLHVVDSTGRELAAKMEVLSPDRLALCVEDTDATYPVRIDPTFSDGDWVSMNPGIPGANSYVGAAVVDGSGNLYIGGSFTFVGTVAANGIAKWDGSTWSALGAGMGNDGSQASVDALAVIGSDLYAGGEFTTAGEAIVNYVAKWNGSAWSSVGFGMGGGGSRSSVYALAVSGTDLYVGGDFTSVGGVAANRIAKWNGSAWSALGAGMGGASSPFVYALVVSGTDLYAGGNFTTAGGVAANRIAKWNGSAWSALGSGMASSVDALAVSGTALYTGGSFFFAGTTLSPFIGKANLAGTLPTITAPTVAGFSGTSGTLGANVTVQGSDAVTSRGVVIAPSAINPNPQIGGTGVTRVATSGSTGVFTVNASGLTPATAYTFAAYATNSIGTSYTATGSFTTLALSSPDITVESPAGTGIASGGLKNFPSATSTTPASVTFTINNPGYGDLTGLAVTIGGLHAADFTVTTAPTALVIAGESSAFTVRFAPPAGNGFITGARNAALHVSNNVAGKSPYTINLSGRALSPVSDNDGDGQSDASEFNMAALGFDWQLNQPALVNNYRSSANEAGYYSLSQVQSLNVNTPLIQRDPRTGQFKLTLGIEKSTNLGNFSLFPFTAPQTSINGQGKIEFLFTSPDDAAFFRLGAE